MGKMFHRLFPSWPLRMNLATALDQGLVYKPGHCFLCIHGLGVRVRVLLWSWVIQSDIKVLLKGNWGKWAQSNSIIHSKIQGDHSPTIHVRNHQFRARTIHPAFPLCCLLNVPFTPIVISIDTDNSLSCRVAPRIKLITISLE